MNVKSAKSNAHVQSASSGNAQLASSSRNMKGNQVSNGLKSNSQVAG